MKKFALVLVALCALTCLFVSCDTAADNDGDDAGSSNPLIGTWVSNEAIDIGQPNPIFVKIIVRAKDAAIAVSPDKKITWYNMYDDPFADPRDFAPYSHTDSTLTVTYPDDKDVEKKETYNYTLSGDTLTVSGGMFETAEVTFTKSNDATTPDATTPATSTPATNPLIGTWSGIMEETGESDGVSYSVSISIKLIVKESTAAIGMSIEGGEWEELDDFVPYTRTASTFTVTYTDEEGTEKTDTYNYTLSGDTLKVSGGDLEGEVTFTKSSDSTTPDATTPDTTTPDATTPTTNSFIGTWESDNLRNESDPYYMKLVIREDSAAMVDSDDEVWEDVPEYWFDSFSISNNTATIDGTVYPYTLNGNTLTVTLGEGYSVTFTKK